MDKKYWIVKKSIDEMDYHSLLAIGAPKDEFDTESREISSRIDSGQSESDIAQIIAEVFNKTFAHSSAKDCFMDCAKKIYRELNC